MMFSCVALAICAPLTKPSMLPNLAVVGGGSGSFFLLRSQELSRQTLSKPRQQDHKDADNSAEDAEEGAEEDRCGLVTLDMIYIVLIVYFENLKGIV